MSDTDTYTHMTAVPVIAINYQLVVYGYNFPEVWMIFLHHYVRHHFSWPVDTNLALKEQLYVYFVHM